ncbi:MAG TPA: DNA repair protein RecO [Candidatus Saccharimonadales bacterium]|nr:DNA repair protein RecO [Candidatus Saccharimonadales bacterium]
MNQLVTTGIILARTDYGEADRILTLLTPEYGKLRLLAKGVRRVKSKLAGGIELFSVSELTFIRGRGEIGTLVSSRLKQHFSHIVQDLDRTMLGYELIRQLNKITEDEAEAEYFELLQQAFEALDDTGVPLELVSFWYAAQLLRLGGHTPNLQTDDTGVLLDDAQTYNFSPERMSFTPAPASKQGRFAANHIKFLRFAFAGNTPHTLARVRREEWFLAELTTLVNSMLAAR